MLGRATGLLLAACMLTAGCLGTSDEDPAIRDDADEGPSPEGTRLGSQSDLPLARENTSLAETPAWALGEWWTYEMQATEYASEGTFTLVVAGDTDDHYLVGIPAGQEDVHGVIFHAPGIGKVAREDLVYDAHDEPFQLLDFPLEEGKSWEGTYWGSAPMTLEVEGTTDTVAEISLTRPSDTGDIVGTLAYDAEVGNIVSFQPDPDASYSLELVDHGFGYEGPVEVPYEQDLLLCHGQLGPAGVQGCELQPGGPEGTFEIPDGYEKVTGALLVAPIEQPGGMTPPGAYDLLVTEPSGTEHQLTVLPGQTGSLQPLHVDEPVGTWTYRALAGGPGQVLVEGVAHQVLEVTL